MSNKDTGGPAFPCERDYGPKFESAEGMTLRDYAAIKAMQGFLSATKYPIQSADWYTFCDGISEQSYDIADAMLEARKDQS